ncbi:MAG: carboxypeptidase regulatory-like domain-containing protein [Myxococcaceae bacterium]
MKQPMRRWWFFALIAVVALGAGLWWALSSGVSSGPTSPDPGSPAPVADFAPVDVRASGNQQALTLTGVVKDPTGAPIADAEVFLAAATQPTFATLRCGVCGELLLSCHAHETARSLSVLFESRRGELQAALTTRSDAQGRFRFEGLSGTSFTVWGHAAGFGDGLKERAAPGELVELFLPHPRTLEGRLHDENGQGVAGVVRLSSRRLARVIEVQAGPDGHFRADGLGEGPFVVSASAPGLLPALAREVQGGDAALELTLRTPRKLEVRVLRDGQPANATLALEGDHLSRQLEVKAGFLVLDQLMPGEVIVTATQGELSSVPTPVTLAGPSTSVTLTLEHGGTIAVTVVDEVGQPVPRPTLELMTRGRERIARKLAQTGELSVFGPVGVGEYLLRVSAEGWQATEVPVVVKAGEGSVEVTLNHATVIAGRVIDEYGRPAPGVSILVTPTGESVIADPEGRFSASVPSPGLYELHAHHSDWGGVDLKVQAPKEDVILSLEPRAGAEVSVTADGKRIEGAQVTLFHRTGNFRSDRSSGADGVVLMRGLPADTYTLVASHPDYLPSERQTLTLRDGDLLKLNAELKPGGEIEGQVFDTQGVPVSGITVTTTSRSAPPQVTDAQGHFKLTPLRPGTTYVLRATQRGFEQLGKVSAKTGDTGVLLVVKRQSVFRGRVLGAGQPLKNFRVDEHEVTSSDGRFELPLPSTDDKVMIAIEAAGFEPLMAERASNGGDLGDFDLKRAPSVTGVVRDEGGQGVADAVVSCEACEQSVRTDESGRFTLGKPAFQREFTVLARKGRRSASKVVTASALTGIELTLKTGVKLGGVAYLPSGQLAAGVEISGVNVDRSETVSVVTGADGRYSLDVAPGTYRFMLGLSPEQAAAEDPPATIVQIGESTTGETQLDFGPVPGLASLTVRVSPRNGWALWLVKGDVSAVGNPPMELLHAPWALLVYQPHSDRVVLGALAPGRYTLVWSSFHAAVEGGPVLTPVTVPASGEVSLVR